MTKVQTYAMKCGGAMSVAGSALLAYLHHLSHLHQSKLGTEVPAEGDESHGLMRLSNCETF